MSKTTARAPDKTKNPAKAAGKRASTQKAQGKALAGSPDLKQERALTPKQEAFCQAVASGETHSDAYRSAYSTENMKPESVNSKAYQLLQRVHIRSRIDELKAELASKQLWTREQSVKALVKALEVAEKGENPAGMTGAVKELNAMHGFSAPQKHELNGSIQHGISVQFVGAPGTADDDS